MPKKVRHRGGNSLVLWNAYPTDRPTGTRYADGRLHRLLVANAPQHGVDAEAPGELAHALDGFPPAFAYDIGRTELLCERDAVIMAAHYDDLLGPETLGGNNPAQPDRSIPDDRHAPARLYPGSDGGVMAGPHYVREREERRHQRIVLSDRQREERPVGERNSHRLGLRAIVARITEEACMYARGVETLAAEIAGSVGEPFKGVGLGVRYDMGRVFMVWSMRAWSEIFCSAFTGPFDSIQSVAKVCLKG